jgi:hypothetical protein
MEGKKPEILILEFERLRLKDLKLGDTVWVRDFSSLGSLERWEAHVWVGLDWTRLASGLMTANPLQGTLYWNRPFQVRLAEGPHLLPGRPFLSNDPKNQPLFLGSEWARVFVRIPQDPAFDQRSATRAAMQMAERARPRHYDQSVLEEGVIWSAMPDGTPVWKLDDGLCPQTSNTWPMQAPPSPYKKGPYGPGEP